MQAYWHKSIYHEAMGADITAGSDNAWVKKALYPDHVPGDAVLVDIVAKVATAAGVVGVRKTGSSLQRKASVAIDGSVIFTVELGDDKSVEVFATVNANVVFNVVGYVTA
jgi:hypothetical protein